MKIECTVEELKELAKLTDKKIKAILDSSSIANSKSVKYFQEKHLQFGQQR